MTRSQMASFLVRTLAQLHDDGEVDALPAPAEVVLDSPEPILGGLEDLRITILGGYVQSVGVRGHFATCTDEQDHAAGVSEDADPSADGFQLARNIGADVPAVPCPLEVFVSRGPALGHIAEDTPLTVVTLPRAPDAVATSEQVRSTDPERNYFVVEAGVYYRYDDSDRLFVGGLAASEEAFEAALDPGDELTVEHFRDPSGESAFRLTTA